MVLNPLLELSDLPIKSYYRYALPAFAASTGVYTSFLSPPCPSPTSNDYAALYCRFPHHPYSLSTELLNPFQSNLGVIFFTHVTLALRWAITEFDSYPSGHRLAEHLDACSWVLCFNSLSACKLPCSLFKDKPWFEALNG